MEQYRLTAEVLDALMPRPEDSHKGTFGTLAALCGSANMPGAAFLSAAGALRSGVGLLQLCVPASIRPILQGKLAEPVWLNAEQLPNDRMTAFLCGCGLGRDSDALLSSLLPRIRVPAVYDADCIIYFALHRNEMDRLSSPFILTPHEMEFSRLAGISPERIHHDRAGTASDFASAHGCIVVLKGHSTVVAEPDGKLWINTTGNSALAKGGSGDVLAGVIASLLAQGHSPADAARIGVYVHGLAGDRLAKEFGVHGVLPHDLPREIGRILG